MNVRVDKLPTFCSHCLGVLGETCVCKRADGGANIVTVHTNINTGDWRAKMPNDSLRTTDDASKAVQKTPNRVTLDSLLEKIVHVEYVRPINLRHMTIAVVLMQNGFAVVGKSAPADPENYNKELGEQFAKEDAVRQLWQLEGYALRERLYGAQVTEDS